MSTSVIKKELANELLANNFKLGNYYGQFSSLFLMKNHSDLDLNITVKLNSTTPVAIPSSKQGLVINNNLTLTNENPTKVVDAVNNSVSFTLKRDITNELPTAILPDVSDSNGVEHHYLESINGSRVPNELNINYLYAQFGLGSTTDGYFINCKVDKKPVELRYLKILPESNPGIPKYFGRTFSVKNCTIPISTTIYNGLEKRPTIFHSDAPDSTYISTNVNGYMSKSYTDPVSGLTKLNVGYAFSVGDDSKVYTASITVDAPYNGVYVNGEYTDPDIFFAEALRNSPEFMALEDAESILASFSFYLWEDNETKLYGDISTVSISKYLTAKNTTDVAVLNNTRRLGLKILPNYEIPNLNGFPVLNIGKDNSDISNTYITQHNDYMVYSVDVLK